jgi:hypothetical protein
MNENYVITIIQSTDQKQTAAMPLPLWPATSFLEHHVQKIIEISDRNTPPSNRMLTAKRLWGRLTEQQRQAYRELDTHRHVVVYHLFDARLVAPSNAPSNEDEPATSTELTDEEKMYIKNEFKKQKTSH